MSFFIFFKFKLPIYRKMQNSAEIYRQTKRFRFALEQCVIIYATDNISTYGKWNGVGFSIMQCLTRSRNCLSDRFASVASGKFSYDTRLSPFILSVLFCWASEANIVERTFKILSVHMHRIRIYECGYSLPQCTMGDISYWMWSSGMDVLLPVCLCCCCRFSCCRCCSIHVCIKN